jgi:F-type H+-transporting ATPase subunit beta
LKDNIRSFQAILSGDMDDISENAFFMAGSIDEVWERAKEMR